MINRTQEEIMKNWGVDNSDTSLVSVKCMTYNHEKYISQAMDGFLMQKTNFPFEILVHDDASTDKTADIIREYEKKFPKIVKPIYETENQWSKGNGAHHIKMDAVIKGKYLALCEGDDYWIDENKLQIQFDFLENNSDYSLVFHSAKIEKEIDEPCGLCTDLIEERDYSATELFMHWIVPTASIFIRKDVYFIDIIDKNLILNGDIVIVEKAAHNGKIRGLSKEMSVYRIQGNGVTYDKKIQKKRLLAYPNHFLILRKNFPLIERKVINKFLIYSYIDIYRNVDKKVKWLIKGFFVDPLFVFTRITSKIFRK